jgi:hypothetical protein
VFAFRSFRIAADVSWLQCHTNPRNLVVSFMFFLRLQPSPPSTKTYVIILLTHDQRLLFFSVTPKAWGLLTGIPLPASSRPMKALSRAARDASPYSADRLPWRSVSDLKGERHGQG